MRYRAPGLEEEEAPDVDGGEPAAVRPHRLTLSE
jgi:hypothetical protein